MNNRIEQFFSRPSILWGIGVVMAVVAALSKYLSDGYNNYQIFRSSWDHLIQRIPLYIEHTADHEDHFHYGIVFALFMAPFAALPDWAGLLLWFLLSTILFIVVIRQLPIERQKSCFILWFLLNELYTSLANQQYNILMGAIIIGAYLFVHRRQDHWATLLIAIGTFTKIIPIGAALFFLFSNRKALFIGSLIGWMILFFLLPIPFVGLDYTIGSYVEWFERLGVKSQLNQFSLMQNISLTGMIRRISGSEFYSDLWFIVPAMLLLVTPLIRKKQYSATPFQLAILASILLFIVLFSNGSESSSYIIALTGVAIWYWTTPSQTKGINLSLLIFAFILTSLSATDLFPRTIDTQFIRPYALKALPCALVWFKLQYELLTYNYQSQQSKKIQ